MAQGHGSQPKAPRPLVERRETLAAEPNSDVGEPHVKNTLAEIKYRGVPVPVVRGYLRVRRHLRRAHETIDKLPPHSRCHLHDLAQAMGNSSELFQYDTFSEIEQLNKLRRG